MQTALKIPGYRAWILCLCSVFAVSPLIADEHKAEFLLYQVQETGQEPYLSRILVTSDFLRMDQGEAAEGFILFDRRKKIIYSVDPAERSILVIESATVKRSRPEQPKITTDQLDAGDAPSVAGSQPQHWRMSVNGEGCQEAVVAPGLMPRSVAAQRDYRQLLAEQHMVTLAAIPADYRDACADAVQVFAPSALLSKGLLLRSWDINGNKQTLLNFSPDRAVSPGQFSLPEDFRRQSLPY